MIERNVPAEYTMTIDERETSFVITNTYTPTYPDDPVPPPQTGDTSNVLMYAMLMIASGTAFIILGIVGKRKNID